MKGSTDKIFDSSRVLKLALMGKTSCTHIDERTVRVKGEGGGDEEFLVLVLVEADMKISWEVRKRRRGRRRRTG